MDSISPMVRFNRAAKPLVCGWYDRSGTVGDITLLENKFHNLRKKDAPPISQHSAWCSMAKDGVTQDEICDVWRHSGTECSSFGVTCQVVYGYDNPAVSYCSVRKRSVEVYPNAVERPAQVRQRLHRAD